MGRVQEPNGSLCGQDAESCSGGVRGGWGRGSARGGHEGCEESTFWIASAAAAKTVQG